MSDDRANEHVYRHEFDQLRDSTEKGFDEIRGSIRVVARKIDDLADRAQPKILPMVSVGIAAAGLVLTFFGLMLSGCVAFGAVVAWGLNNRLDTTTAAISELDGKFDAHLMSEGHPTVVGRVQAHGDRLDAIELWQKTRRWSADDTDRYVFPRLENHDGRLRELEVNAGP